MRGGATSVGALEPQGAVLVRLSNGFCTLVEAGDLSLVARGSWRAVRTTPKWQRLLLYASGRVGREQISLHRYLMGSPPGLVIDHINGDGLDNRRCNLRAVTREENGRNQFHTAAPLACGQLPEGVPIVTLADVRAQFGALTS